MRTRLLCLLTLGLLPLLLTANEWEGKTVPKLVLADGTTYTEVTFSIIDNDAITITHSEGLARVPMESLKPEARAALGYNPAKTGADRMTANTPSADEPEKPQSPPVAISCEVWEVRENGFIVYDLYWMDDPVRTIRKEDFRQFITIGDSDDFDIYEGKKLDLHARDAGTITIDGRRLKHWIYVPPSEAGSAGDGRFPSDYR